ncbi:MAG: hypothetical protein OXF20_03565 [Gammaproteobacteria bacterium]|nr:hypothetical protein [Gammaproteobacteria bacterium]
MKILFDHGTLAPLRHYLTEHLVDLAEGKGCETLENGKLIRRAEETGYRVIVTTDKNMQYQQNLKGRSLAIVVLQTPAWPKVCLRAEEIRIAIKESLPGEVTEVPI